MKNRPQHLLPFFLLLMVMIFAILLSHRSALIDSADSDAFPQATDDFYVNDYAGILDENSQETLFDMGRSLDQATGAQVVVVILDDVDISDIDTYANGLFRSWGIGDSEENNGVLLLLDMNQRKIRIEVGYGLEGALTDGYTGRIQDQYILPSFEDGDYSTGIVNGYTQVVNAIYTEYGLSSPYTSSDNQDSLTESSDDTSSDDTLTSDISSQADSDDTQETVLSPIVSILGVILIIFLVFLDFRFTGGFFILSILSLLFRRGGGGGFGGGSGGNGGGFGGGGGSSGGGGSNRNF